MDIEFITVHKSKGLEADNVIVINMENKLSGFPNKINDDPILSLVLSKSDDYEYAEERRLLYVAMTRTKNLTFLLAPDSSKSIFVDELMSDNKNLCYSKATLEDIISDNPKCPRCIKGTLVIRDDGNGKKFLGCSNYPQCDRTYSDIEILKDKIVCKLCDGFMVKREGKQGQFYGCSNYPMCENTINDINTYSSESSKTEVHKASLSESRIKRIKQYPPAKRFPWGDKQLRRTGKRRTHKW